MRADLLPSHETLVQGGVGKDVESSASVTRAEGSVRGSPPALFKWERGTTVKSLSEALPGDREAHPGSQGGLVSMK